MYIIYTYELKMKKTDATDSSFPLPESVLGGFMDLSMCIPI